MKTRVIERVKWEDACQWDDDISADDLDDQGCIYETVGFVARESERYLYLSRETNEGIFRRTIAIPKGMILERESIMRYQTEE